MKKNYPGKAKTPTKQDRTELLLPRIRRDDDIFIVSFPRSGNTWMLFILANIMVEVLNLKMKVNFFNIHGFIPDIHVGRDLPEYTGFFPFKRMIKSHSVYHPGYKNVIYIIRDPKNVMVSYYNYMVGLGHYDRPISEFVKDKKLGVPAWSKHVTGWMDGIAAGTRFRIIKYEDFHNEPDKNIKKLGNLIGFDLSDGQVSKVRDNCSFKAMQKLEKETGSLSLRRKNTNIQFIRKGSLTDWENELGAEEVAYIRSVVEKMPYDFGYAQ